MTRILVLGDMKSSGGGGGNQSWVRQFSEILKEKKIIVDYIGDQNTPINNSLHSISPRSNINSEVLFNNVKTPVDALSKMYYVMRRVYEQLGKKVYDAYIVNRMDFLPVIHALGLSKNVPTYVPTHDISFFENIVTPCSSSTEMPYRLVHLMEHFATSSVGLNIISSSDYLTKTIKDFNPAHNIETLPIPLNAKVKEASMDPLPFEKTSGVLWVGNQTAYKNPQLLFEIVKANPHMKFTCVINSASKSVLTKFMKKYSADNLTVLGSQPIEKLIELYRSHRLGIITSSVETFCIVAQEQQLFHPTLIWNKSCNQYHKIWNHLEEFGDVKQASALIKGLYNDKEYYVNKVNRSKESIFKEYDMDLVKNKYFAFIDKIQIDFDKMNPFRSLNTMGAMIQSRVGLLDEYSYEDLLEDLKYADNTLGQLSVFSQLSQFDRKEYRNKTVFISKE